MQVVNALIEADKPFDLLVIPGANHTSGGAYGQHKRFDYFIEHLYGINPPVWADLEAARTNDEAVAAVADGQDWSEIRETWIDNGWRR